MDLMQQISAPATLNQACMRVVGKKGGPGVDGRTVHGLWDWLAEQRPFLRASLLSGAYQPWPVLRVTIPKPEGGYRELGIPTVGDRLIQQAILSVLSPKLDSSFSPFSYGFRPGLGAHDAVLQARAYVADGADTVVDCDLERFFDTVAHDVLMEKLERRIRDRRLLAILRAFLEADALGGGELRQRRCGLPQGGPLSPFLANLLLDDLDRMLEARGLRFCRYADDCNIYVTSPEEGAEVMARVTDFLEGTLLLRVNREKSAVAPVGERAFLGYRLLPGGELGVAPRSLDRARKRIRAILYPRRNLPWEGVREKLRTFMLGWLTYYRLADYRCALRELILWIRSDLARPGGFVP